MNSNKDFQKQEKREVDSREIVIKLEAAKVENKQKEQKMRFEKRAR